VCLCKKTDDKENPLIIKRGFSTISEKMHSSKRIGPHNIDIISIIVGSTLGDTHLEKRTNGKGTRVIFEQSNKNVEYLMWFHYYLASRGYCSTQTPKLHKRIRKNGEIFFHYRINSYTFSSFNWLHEMFYKLDSFDSLIDKENQISASVAAHPDSPKPKQMSIDGYVLWRRSPSNVSQQNSLVKRYVKAIPANLEDFLTPLALAIWFSDDGSKLGKGAKIATNCFTTRELEYVCDILHNKYKIITSLHSGGTNKGEVIYIWTKSMPIFSKIVKPFMLPSLHYKLGDY